MGTKLTIVHLLFHQEVQQFPGLLLHPKQFKVKEVNFLFQTI